MKLACRGITIATLFAALALGLSHALAETVTITAPDKTTEKAKVKLATGDILELKLEMTSGTGYSWAVGKNAKDMLPQQGEAIFEKPKTPRPGAKQLQVFRFKATSRGTSELELVYRRPFEKDKPPAKTFALTVDVVDTEKK